MTEAGVSGFFVQNDPAITISGLLLPHNFELSAITTTQNVNFSLQLIVELLSTGTKQVAPVNSKLHLIVVFIRRASTAQITVDHPTPAIICNDSFKFIDTLASEGAQFAQIFYRPSDLNSSQLIVNLISGIRASTNIINGSFKLQQLIVIYSKRSLHFRKDCGIFVRENGSNIGILSTSSASLVSSDSTALSVSSVSTSSAS